MHKFDFKPLHPFTVIVDKKELFVKCDIIVDACLNGRKEWSFDRGEIKRIFGWIRNIQGILNDFIQPEFEPEDEVE